jgi:hypothetical protein
MEHGAAGEFFTAMGLARILALSAVCTYSFLREVVL